MTPEQKMQKVVEAAGECWHEVVSELRGIDYVRAMCSCGKQVYDPSHNCGNPSPTDLNELFRLAEKLGPMIVLTFKRDCMTVIRLWGAKTEENTPAEALLNALYEAVS
jgi:hypothetical protein